MEPRKLKDLFSRDAHAAVLAVIRDSDRPLRRGEVIDLLAAAGVPKAEAARKWDNSVQPLTLTRHPHVRLNAAGWAWTDETPDADVALTQLRAMIDKRKKHDVAVGDALTAVISRRLGTSPAAGSDESAIRAAQDRQLSLDGMRRVAELAGEMEFVAYNTDDPDAIVERVRGGAERLGLIQIGEVGGTSDFDPGRHTPIGPPPDTGSTVRIVRPGYSWRYRDEVVLLQKAEVAAH